MLSGLSKTRFEIVNKLSRSKKNVTESDPDVDFTISLSDNIRLIEPGIEPICNTCKYMIDDILDIRKSKITSGKYSILMYSVCTIALKPFLLFKLIRQNDKCLLPTLTLDKTGEIPVVDDNMIYQGMIPDENILVYEFNYSDSDVKKISSADDSVIVSVDDIINQKHTFNYKIDEDVISLFLKYEQLIYLQDDMGELVETPMTAYRGEYYMMVGVLAGLGVPRSGPYSSLGPYFKFADFARALRFGVVSLNGKPQYVGDEKITREETPVFTKGGIVKYMLFLGNTKVLLNLSSDPDDDSSESIKLAESRLFIKDTLKLRDSAGKWASKYDSIMQPLITIYDSELKRERQLDPQVVVKEFRQQHPIQYAYLDTSKVTLDKETGFYNIKESHIE
jgi:hypothetical protein